MSVSQPDVIDYVSVAPGASSAVHLVIVDDLEWTPLENHLALLKSKVNAYVHVLVSGNLKEHVDLPLPPTPAVTLVLVVVHQPPAEAKPFLERVAEVLGGLGAELQVVSVPAYEELIRRTSLIGGV